ncbi:ORF23 [White spot syndrome virus]|uniref:ORF23 n=1 Tax=White spot syndrome virus TaxID=342409 RepID=A0A2D3I696_9VIRU|nr:ORF23 [White spot syndrome virus]
MLVGEIVFLGAKRLIVSDGVSGLLSRILLSLMGNSLTPEAAAIFDMNINIQYTLASSDIHSHPFSASTWIFSPFS